MLSASIRKMGVTHAATIAAALLFSATALASAECTCRFKGGNVTEGKTACITTAKGKQLARCEKFQNVSTWVNLGIACTGQPEQQAALAPR
jgi:hypothetical protein